MDDTLRDTGRYDMRNISVGAFLAETAEVAAAVAMGSTPRGIGVRVTADTLLSQHSSATRQRIWDAIHYRHFSCSPLFIARAVVETHAIGADSPEFRWLLYLHYVLRDHLTYDLVQQLLWPAWSAGEGIVTMDGGMQLLESAQGEHPNVCRWSEDSRRRLIRSIFETLEEFGVLRWTSGWHIERPQLTPYVVEHLLRLLVGEGVSTGEALTTDPTWRVFLVTPREVEASLLALGAEHGALTFESRGGDLVFTAPPDW